MVKILCIYSILLFSILAFSVQAGASEKSFMSDIKESNEKFDSSAVVLDKMVTEENVLSIEKSHGRFFRVLSRKKYIERFKCSNCHTEKPVTVNQALELTHGDIAIAHGREGQVLTCFDCHSFKERDFLEDRKGKKIDFDHSYQLCGQCHFRQKRDWLGGAHGKRVSNWVGERVVFTCTTCHDPHSPLFKKRFPATYSVPLD